MSSASVPFLVLAENDECEKMTGGPMRKLSVIEFLSLDGVMQAPGAPDEDTAGRFQHGGRQQPYFDDLLGAYAAEGMATTDAYLFGRLNPSLGSLRRVGTRPCPDRATRGVGRA